MSTRVNTDRYQPPRQQRGQGASAMAWATLIFGVGAWVLVPLVGAVVALLCGFVERRKIAEGTSAPEGQPLVKVGLIAAGVQLVVVGVALVGLLVLCVMWMLGAMFA